MFCICEVENEKCFICTKAACRTRLKSKTIFTAYSLQSANVVADMKLLKLSIPPILPALLSLLLLGVYPWVYISATLWFELFHVLLFQPSNLHQTCLITIIGDLHAIKVTIKIMNDGPRSYEKLSKLVVVEHIKFLKEIEKLYSALHLDVEFLIGRYLHQLSGCLEEGRIFRKLGACGSRKWTRSLPFGAELQLNFVYMKYSIYNEGTRAVLKALDNSRAMKQGFWFRRCVVSAPSVHRTHTKRWHAANKKEALHIGETSMEFRKR